MSVRLRSQIRTADSRLPPVPGASAPGIVFGGTAELSDAVIYVSPAASMMDTRPCSSYGSHEKGSISEELLEPRRCSMQIHLGLDSLLGLVLGDSRSRSRAARETKIEVIAAMAIVTKAMPSSITKTPTIRPLRGSGVTSP